MMRRNSRVSLWARRFIQNKTAVVGLIILAVLVFCAVFGEMIVQAALGWTYATTDFTAVSKPPSARHWFGSAGIGYDIAAQVFHGLARSLLIAVAASAVITALAAFIGAGAAYLGGIGEKIILAVIHLLLVVPTFLVLALVAITLPGDRWALLAALVATGWMVQAWVIWSMSLPLREADYMTAARYMGIGGWRTVVRHMLPNLGSYLAFTSAMGVVAAVSAEIALAFFGLGVRPPDVSLGSMLADGSRALRSEPWRFYFPALALTLLTVSMALVADGLRDALDPRTPPSPRVDARRPNPTRWLKPHRK